MGRSGREERESEIEMAKSDVKTRGRCKVKVKPVLLYLFSL